MKHVIVNALLRNGVRVRYRRLLEDEFVGPFRLLGWMPHPQQAFVQGDPELWTEAGVWREDGKQSEFDIVSNLGVEAII